MTPPSPVPSRLDRKRVRVRQCVMQLTYEVDARRRALLVINVGKYLSAFPVIWLSGYNAMRQHEGMRHVSLQKKINVLVCMLRSVFIYSFVIII